MAVNKVILIGNLGKDPQVYHMDGGLAKAAFSVATNESYKDKEGQWITKTEWHNVVAWGGWAKYAERNLHKGKQVYVEGKLANRSYEDKTGVTRYVVEVVCNYLRLLGKRDDNMYEMGHAEKSNNPAAQESKPASENAVDDLPF